LVAEAIFLNPKDKLMRLKNKIAVITGATSGIGKATALRFAEEGADLVITGRRSTLGKSVEAECRQRLALSGVETGIRCVFVEADHSKMEDCQRVVDVAIEEFNRIDILFNNAGIVTSGTAETTDEETWQRTLDINVTAVWRMSKLVIPIMKRQGGGVIVNNGSDWSVVAGRDAFPYVMSKGAVGMMTKAMALDFARDGIRVNAVCPGDTLVERWLETGYFEGSNPIELEEEIRKAGDYLPLGRFGKPEEIANAVLFLASDESSFVTGHLLLVDGGNTAQ
jgi:meso-butanediol dehydrogenase/(S,S)-butanediol dehydrogenase/diacetyl reductase